MFRCRPRRPRSARCRRGHAHEGTGGRDRHRARVFGRLLQHGLVGAGDLGAQAAGRGHDARLPVEHDRSAADHRDRGLRRPVDLADGRGRRIERLALLVDGNGDDLAAFGGQPVDRAVLGDGDIGIGAELRIRVFDLRLERRDTLRGDDPQLAGLLVEDRRRAVAECDLRGRRDAGGVAERDACGIDGGQGRGVLVHDEDVARVLQDVVVLARGAQTAVENRRLVVEVPDEQARRLGDPDAAVVQIDLGGGEALIAEGHGGDGDDADRDTGGRRQCLGSCAHP